MFKTKYALNFIAPDGNNDGGKLFDTMQELEQYVKTQLKYCDQKYTISECKTITLQPYGSITT